MNRKKLIKDALDSYQKDLAQLVSIPSVIDESSQDTPFGQPIQDALEATLNIAKKLGFETYLDRDGYYGYAQIGSQEALFGVLGHIDVVPIGDINKWESNPFELVEKEGRYYGRGSGDDKGPVLAAMYALKIMLDNGFKPTSRIRFIFGTDEETLWRCMNAYSKLEEMPSMGFSPDSAFPLIYAEKGLVQLNIKANDNIDFEFAGGDAYNSVPSKIAIAYSKHIEKALKHLGYQYEIEDKQIIVIGKSVHSQMSDQGINAITRLCEALADKKTDSSLLNFILDKGLDPNGTPVFGPIEDPHSGKLMFNIGKINFTKNKQSIGLDMRIPVTYDKEDLMLELYGICSDYGLEVEEVDYLRSIYVDKESVLVKALMSAYQSVTKDFVSEPKASGGATYARAMDNCVAFGAFLPTSEKTAHQPNEYINISDVETAMEIYMKAFELLVLEEK